MSKEIPFNLHSQIARKDLSPVNWHRVTPGFDLWACECGLEFELTYGTPAENNMNFCPQCGNLIRVIDEDDES